MSETLHTHRWQHYHADYCHQHETGYICECGEKKRVDTRTRDFSHPDSAWWHWGRSDCAHCVALMQAAGLNPSALADERLACLEINRQWASG